MHNIFCNSLSILIELGEELNKANIPSTLLGEWLQRAQAVKNSRGWVKVVPFPPTISGPDNQDILAKHPDN